MTSRSRRQPEVECDYCGLFGMCRVAGLGSEESMLEKLVARRYSVPKATALVRAGQRFDCIYAVKSGAFKTVADTPEGKEKIIAFHLPGELIGLEALDGERHTFGVEALENSSVCRLSYGSSSFVLGARIQEFHHQLIHAMSRQMLHEQWMNSLLGTNSAEQRVAAFVVNVARRFGERNLPADRFRLPMSREDIANYLGLAVETVSRMFKQFQSRGLLSASGRQTQILDFEGLNALAGLDPYQVQTQ